MVKFSANLGLLWRDRPLIEAVQAAHRAGFDAVECHWPYETPPELLAQVLAETGLLMLSLNTVRGDVSKGENGLCAVPHRRNEARAAIDQALAYAVTANIPNIHVMAGVATGDEAHDCFISHLAYGCEQAARYGKTILIEPLNHYDAPGYFLSDLDQAIAIIEAVGAQNLKLMFDCYHIQILHGDLTRALTRYFDFIGHIQFASVPSRGAPDGGEVNYQHIFSHIASLGYQAPLGAEYHPDSGDSDASLGWLASYER